MSDDDEVQEPTVAPMPVMMCGHTAQGLTNDGMPVCVPCLGIVPGADEVRDLPDMHGRRAKCSYHEDGPWAVPGNKDPHVNGVPSNTRLPFFEYRPLAEFVLFYCGCRGWD